MNIQQIIEKIEFKLKEIELQQQLQEAKIQNEILEREIENEQNNSWQFKCGNCNNILFKKYKQCPYCGCFIDWDKYDDIGANN